VIVVFVDNSKALLEKIGCYHITHVTCAEDGRTSPFPSSRDAIRVKALTIPRLAFLGAISTTATPTAPPNPTLHARVIAAQPDTTIPNAQNLRGSGSALPYSRGHPCPASSSVTAEGLSEVSSSSNRESRRDGDSDDDRALQQPATVAATAF